MSHNSKGATKGSKNESKNAATQQVKNTAASTRRVETRDMWEVIFNHSVVLIAAYAKGIKVENPREGFAFGPTATQPHSRDYAKSLIWGFTTNKAAKVLKNLDDVADKAIRVKIATAILTDCKLVKGDSEAIKKSLDKVEPRRERVVAEAVLKELTKPEPKKATTKGGKGGKKSDTKKATTPKGGSSKSESSKPATKGGKKSSTKASK